MVCGLMIKGHTKYQATTDREGKNTRIVVKVVGFGGVWNVKLRQQIKER